MHVVPVRYLQELPQMLLEGQGPRSSVQLLVLPSDSIRLDLYGASQSDRAPTGGRKEFPLNETGERETALRTVLRSVHTHTQSEAIA